MRFEETKLGGAHVIELERRVESATAALLREGQETRRR